MPSKQIAVIGAGPFGLTATKCLIEEGHFPVVFERTGHCGGLWRYHDEDIDGLASVMKTTIFNSSKEMSAFSDFPPPENFANFMRHHQVHEYIMAYTKKFDLEKYIHFHKDVVKIEFANDYDLTGRLVVTFKDTKADTTSCDTFDGVVVCVGHHVYPYLPTFQGMESFKGKCIHTRSLKKVDQFEDKRVVILGIGNSAVDAAVEISSVAQQVYLSSRKGAWILPRVGPWGLPFDIVVTRKWLDFLFKFSPYRLVCWFCELMLNHHRFNHDVYCLKPKHRIWSQHPTISDNLPIKLMSGSVLVRKNISRFMENGVVFEDENEVTPCDIVVFATGYKITFPFLDEKMTTIKNNEPHLYKYMFPPHLKHPSLVIVGLFQSLGAGFPIAEIQSRWAALVLKGERTLPSHSAMEHDVLRKKAMTWSRFPRSERHTVQVDYIPFLDEISSQFGAKPNLLKIFFTDNKLFWTLMFGPSLPYQYRLSGPHPWKGARDALLQWEEHVKRPTKKDFKGESLSVVSIFKYILIIILLLFVVHLGCIIYMLCREIQ